MFAQIHRDIPGK